MRFLNLKNLILTLGLLARISCISCISFTSNCNCNIIVDSRIFYQLSIYGGICSLVTLITLVSLIALVTLVTYKMKALEPDTYIFEDYKLGKKSPRTLKNKLK